ncbi:MAG: hypothetical protein CME70_02130 [Halobacteriovorax sp.]|nr:hypothetical protein [Halobacteriovorax sp.]|tara:strand:+ start:37550 stop:37837 length:288 start_codon:yes stop_codon:yes gene_type:complete
MANAAKKKNSEDQQKREQQRQAEREQWQQEFIARQNFMQSQMEHRRELRKLPKSALIFIGFLALVFSASVVLFLMSFNPATSSIVDKVMSFFKFY